MQSLIVTIQPHSPFGGSIRGDTLFGQLCWAARHRWGESHLGELLEGYTDNNPFMVVSDAFPAGHLPRPALPMHRFSEVSDADRKQVKKRSWLPREQISRPLTDWLQFAVSGKQIAERDLFELHTHSHNTINRLTGTTGTGVFSPYAMSQQWFAPGQAFDLYIVHNEERLGAKDVRLLLEDVGLAGYGRDASIGLGKFAIITIDDSPWPAQEKANTWMTLAPCAPQGMDLNPEKCWYQPFTRFGRHGDMAVHSGKPFKTPLLMADTAALITPVSFFSALFTGQGLGGDGSLSNAIPETVHQGYAPVLAVYTEEPS